MGSRLTSQEPSLSHPWRHVFLSELERSANASIAADLAGVSRDTIHRHAREDGTFRADWLQALRRHWDRRLTRFFAVLEATGDAALAAERAGVSRTLVYKLRRRVEISMRWELALDRWKDRRISRARV